MRCGESRNGHGCIGARYRGFDQPRHTGQKKRFRYYLLLPEPDTTGIDGINSGIPEGLALAENWSKSWEKLICFLANIHTRLTKREEYLCPQDSEWKRLSDSLAAKALTPANLRRLNRAIFGSAFGASLDGQGRIILPFSLREYAGIGDSAIVVGANNCVELWCEGEWQAAKTSAEEQASEIIENFGA
jgi:division/cell wall cluster transcriptional repressor MraZ